ncbi:mRNA cleavage and polyadenylation specificity factor complex associated protein [Sugiyamaella lignohabitans]|uniref:mRNA cleavage and polyadenylation specificity factor complex associated protein n=1 Tax=Sugiyamaella lignohabitans TaxID=796027 RepID=A0A167CFW9_9ASCO|nr:mRNA cleavage and polyadenylation specificity factor complex associated protein [Sugiyamaella lignohabitans]ANB11636.1 mRNA cleavage and polyadenylation specificity factor complex associated protein [Sugiyamaella lignohabitans]
MGQVSPNPVQTPVTAQYVPWVPVTSGAAQTVPSQASPTQGLKIDHLPVPLQTILMNPPLRDRPMLQAQVIAEYFQAYARAQQEQQQKQLQKQQQQQQQQQFQEQQLNQQQEQQRQLELQRLQQLQQYQQMQMQQQQQNQFQQQFQQQQYAFMNQGQQAIPIQSPSSYHQALTPGTQPLPLPVNYELYQHPPTGANLSPSEVEKLQRQQQIVLEQQKRLELRRDQDAKGKNTGKRTATGTITGDESQAKRSKISPSPLNVAEFYRQQQLPEAGQTGSPFNATDDIQDKLDILNAQSPPVPLKLRIRPLFTDNFTDMAFVGEKFRDLILEESKKEWKTVQDDDELSEYLNIALDNGSPEFWKTFDDTKKKFLVRITNWMRHLIRDRVEGKHYGLLLVGLKVLAKINLSTAAIESLKLEKTLAKAMEHGDAEIRNLCRQVLKIAPKKVVKTAPPARPAVITKKPKPSTAASSTVPVKAVSSAKEATTKPAPSVTGLAPSKLPTSKPELKPKSASATATSDSSSSTTTTNATRSSSSSFFDTIKSAKVSKPASSSTSTSTGPTSLKSAVSSSITAASQKAKPAATAKPSSAPMTMLFSGAASIKSQIEKNKEKAVITGSKSSAGPETKKKTKVKKSVHWKAADDLVQVRYISDGEDNEEEPHHKMHASDRRTMDFHEALQFKNIPEIDEELDWYEPVEFDWQDDVKKSFRRAGYLKRGGILEPKSEEAKIQKARESHALIAVYTSVDDVPDNPSPPDASDEANDLKTNGNLVIIRLPEELELNPIVLKFNDELLIRQKIEQASQILGEVTKLSSQSPPQTDSTTNTSNKSALPPLPPPPPPPSVPPAGIPDLSDVFKFLGNLAPIQSRSGFIAPPPPQSGNDNSSWHGSHGQDDDDRIKQLRSRDVRPYVRNYKGHDSYNKPCSFFARGTCKFGEKCKNVHEGP